ncbi:hypothetical protein BJ742DRAFT_810535 [Cladochytrium replicatum]|nr:hypothetical protein BJ742DRAFT_810535 [Cladochytrium replicatum]
MDPSSSSAALERARMLLRKPPTPSSPSKSKARALSLALSDSSSSTSSLEPEFFDELPSKQPKKKRLDAGLDSDSDDELKSYLRQLEDRKPGGKRAQSSDAGAARTYLKQPLPTTTRVTSAPVSATTLRTTGPVVQTVRPKLESALLQRTSLLAAASARKSALLAQDSDSEISEVLSDSVSSLSSKGKPATLEMLKSTTGKSLEMRMATVNDLTRFRADVKHGDPGKEPELLQGTSRTKNAEIGSNAVAPSTLGVANISNTFQPSPSGAHANVTTAIHPPQTKQPFPAVLSDLSSVVEEVPDGVVGEDDGEWEDEYSYTDDLEDPEEGYENYSSVDDDASFLGNQLENIHDVSELFGGDEVAGMVGIDQVFDEEIGIYNGENLGVHEELLADGAAQQEYTGVQDYVQQSSPQDNRGPPSGDLDKGVATSKSNNVQQEISQSNTYNVQPQTNASMQETGVYPPPQAYPYNYSYQPAANPTQPYVSVDQTYEQYPTVEAPQTYAQYDAVDTPQPNAEYNPVEANQQYAPFTSAEVPYVTADAEPPQSYYTIYNNNAQPPAQGAPSRAHHQTPKHHRPRHRSPVEQPRQCVCSHCMASPLPPCCGHGHQSCAPMYAWGVPPPPPIVPPPVPYYSPYYPYYAPPPMPMMGYGWGVPRTHHRKEQHLKKTKKENNEDQVGQQQKRDRGTPERGDQKELDESEGVDDTSSNLSNLSVSSSVRMMDYGMSAVRVRVPINEARSAAAATAVLQQLLRKHVEIVETTVKMQNTLAERIREQQGPLIGREEIAEREGMDTFRYTTLEDTKAVSQYIAKHRRPSLTFEEALRMVQREEQQRTDEIMI